MKERYGTILLGGSMLALGYASRHPDVVVVERGELLAPEYTACFRPATTEKAEPVCGLREFLRSRGVIEADGAVQTLPLLPALCGFVLEREIPVQLLTAFVSARREGGDWVVTVCHNGGLQEVRAVQVIDTRTPAGGPCFFHLVCNEPPVSLEEKLTAAVPEGVEVLAVHTRRASFLTFRLPPETTLPAARELALRTFAAAFPDGEAKISVMGFALDRRPGGLCGEADNGWRQVPGSEAEGPLSAWRRGEKIAEEEGF